MNFIVFMIISFLSKAAALGREVSIGTVWGISSVLDVFMLTLVIPVLFIDVASAAINSSFIPVFSKEHAERRCSTLFQCAAVLAMFLVLTSGLLWLIVPIFVQASVEDIAGLDEMIAAFLPAVICYYSLMVAAELARALLLVKRKQWVIPTSTVLGNGAFVFYVIYVIDGSGAEGLAVAFMLFGLIQISVLAITLLASSSLSAVHINAREWGSTKRIMSRVPYLALGSASTHLNKAVDKVLASGVTVGGVSAVYFSQQLYGIFVNFIVVAVLQFFYPQICEAAGKREESRVVGRTVVLMLLLTGLSVIFGLGLAEQLTAIVYERGSFDSGDTELVSKLFMIYLAGLTFEALSALYKRFYWAREMTRVTVNVGIFAVVFNVGFSLLLSNAFGLVGIALATSLTHIASWLILVFMYHSRVMEVRPSIATFSTVALYMLGVFLCFACIIGVLYEVLAGGDYSFTPHLFALCTFLILILWSKHHVVLAVLK